ncbi:MAG: TRAP transporter substrate-binding protein DctP [Alphaproteobacteria bacterium]|nr:TRAP transporter substrate-binding protein DctP [Alphaproteobacteria bacterium]
MSLFSRLAFASVALAALMVLPNMAQAKTRILTNCFWPPQHYVCTQVMPTWGEWVEEATDGRVSIQIPPKSLAAPPEQWGSVEKGIADAAAQFNGFVANRVTGPLVAMQPFVASADAPAMSEALWETYQKFFPDEYKGVKALSMWVITPAEVYSQNDTPINSIDDLTSRKIWALPGTVANLMKKIGVGVVAGPAVQANEVISRGVVDGHIGLSPVSIDQFQLGPYTKSMTRFKTRIYSTSFSFVMNEDKWAEISPEDQEAIMAVSGPKFGRMAAQFWVDGDAAAIAKFKDQWGIEVYDADPAFEAALTEQSKFLTEGWIKKANSKGIDGQAAYDFYVQRVKELSKL